MPCNGLRAAALALAAVAAAIACGCGHSGYAASTASRSITRGPRAPEARFVPRGRGKLVTVRYRSAALRRRDSYLAYLPPGYAAAAARGYRFPVFFILHGDGPGYNHTATQMARAADVANQADGLIKAGSVQPLVIVMPESASSDPVADSEWADTRLGRFASSVVDLAHAVDRRWATVPSRSARAIGGLSMGGYGAINITLHHLDVFSVAESWSGYFSQRRQGPFDHAGSAALRANSPRAYVRGQAVALRASPIHVLLYAAFGDPLASQQPPFARELRRYGVPVTTAMFHGPHDYPLWRAHLPFALRFAGRWLRRSG